MDATPMNIEKTASSLSATDHDFRPISPAESTISEKPIAPKSSRQSYDGRDHHSHKEAHKEEITEELYKLVEEGGEDNGDAAPQPKTESDNRRSSLFFARQYDEKKIMKAMLNTPAVHDYNGYVYSRQSARPRGVANYFLPIVNQPSARKHVQAPLAGVPLNALHRNLKSVPTGLMPLSAVRLTWCSTTRHTVYSLHSLYAYCSRFGSVEGVYQRSANSALVIFCELASARACVKCPKLGMPWDLLVASWWEPQLHNQGYLSGHVRQEERNSLVSLEGPALRDEIPSEARISIST